MKKECPCCGTAFSCWHDEITKCFCTEIKLTPEKKAFISKYFEGCLCEKCLLDIASLSSDKNMTV